MIPYAREYTAYVTGAVIKFVKCETCGSEYVYRMVREEIGTGTSLLFLNNTGASQRASKTAEHNLNKALEIECDPVPCPECGWYQVHMHATIRGSYCSWLYYLGVFLLFASPMCFVFTFVAANSLHPAAESTVAILWVVTGLLAVLGIGAIFTRKVMASGYDPNKLDVEQRRQLGQSLTIPKADFDKLRESAEQEGTPE